MFDANQMDSATADRLKSDRSGDRFSALSHSEITKQSTATITVPVGGPNKSTDAKTNASDTENRASMDGTFIENDPVSKVRAARINHWFDTGALIRTYA